MTNITREHIEDWIAFIRMGTASASTGHGSAIWDARIDEISALALRALDTPSVEEIEAKAYERAACAAEGPLLEINDNTGEARYRGTAKGNWTVPQPIAGFHGSDYGTGRYDAATAIRALSPVTTRYVELPEGHFFVPHDEADLAYWKDFREDDLWPEEKEQVK